MLLGGLAGERRLGAFVGMNGWLPFQSQLDDILGIKMTPVLSSPETEPVDEEDSSDSEEEEDSSESEDNGGVDCAESADEYSSNNTSQLDDLSAHHSGVQDFDLFGNSSDEGNSVEGQRADISRPIQALDHIRDILDPSPLATTARTLKVLAQPLPYLETSVFLGHGAADPKVSIKLGENMARTLSTEFNMDVTWRSYEDSGHWYKVPDEIDDILNFLENKTGVLVEKKAAHDSKTTKTYRNWIQPWTQDYMMLLYYKSVTRQCLSHFLAPPLHHPTIDQTCPIR